MMQEKLMQEKPYRKYAGEALEHYNAACNLDAYLPGDELKKAVEIARLLQRPLLLRGEPGCGKTRLAEALAFELYGEEYKQYYFEWYTKSSSKARDGLYQFDHLGRLRDIEIKDPKPLKEYLRLGPLGKAFEVSTAEKPAVVLIDEIDKADIDFPNDLLRELEQKKFEIPEVPDGDGPTVVAARYPPIIIITSNDEKELPNAFLRRCVFHYIEFPSENLLVDIARKKLEARKEDIFNDKHLLQLVKKFRELHSKMSNDHNTDKSPSTSELLDWIQVLAYYTYNSDKKERPLEITEEELVFKEERLPFPGVILKSYDDYRSQMGGTD